MTTQAWNRHGVQEGLGAAVALIGAAVWITLIGHQITNGDSPPISDSHVVSTDLPGVPPRPPQTSTTAPWERAVPKHLSKEGAQHE